MDKLPIVHSQIKGPEDNDDDDNDDDDDVATAFSYSMKLSNILVKRTTRSEISSVQFRSTGVKSVPYHAIF